MNSKTIVLTGTDLFNSFTGSGYTKTRTIDGTQIVASNQNLFIDYDFRGHWNRADVVIAFADSNTRIADKRVNFRANGANLGSSDNTNTISNGMPSLLHWYKVVDATPTESASVYLPSMTGTFTISAIIITLKEV